MAAVGDLCHFFLLRVEVIPSLVDRTVAVAQNDMVRIQTHRDQQADNGKSGCTGTAGHHVDVVNILAGELQCVEHSCQCDNGSTVLVIVENRNVTAFLQTTLDLEAAGCGNVFQIDTTKAAGDQANRFYDLVHILGANAKRNRIDIAETLEQCTFALHDRHAGFRSDVAQSENGGAVGDDCDQIAAACQVIAFGNIFLNFQTRLCNAGGVRQRKIIGGFQRCTKCDFDLALPFVVQFQRFCCIIHNFFVPFQPINCLCSAVCRSFCQRTVLVHQPRRCTAAVCTEICAGVRVLLYYLN